MVAITQPAGVPFILNDYPQLLADVPAEGCHLGQEDGSIADARRVAGRPIIVGRSTHSIEQAITAEKEGADYIGYGPLFPTPTKPDAVAVGLFRLPKPHAQVPIPIFSTCGVKKNKIPKDTHTCAQTLPLLTNLPHPPHPYST